MPLMLRRFFAMLMPYAFSLPLRYDATAIYAHMLIIYASFDR